MGIVKKIFENSKGKASQKDRRNFIDELIKCIDADKFKEKINNEEKIKKLFGEDEKKSDTLRFINRIRDLVNGLKDNITGKEASITDLLNGKIPGYKKPSSIATITSKDCKETAEIILYLFKKNENSKGKASQKLRRIFIDELIECDDADEFEQKINNEEKIKKLFGEDEKKSDTLKFINKIRNLVTDLKNNNTGKEAFITDLLNGKIPDYKKPSSIATITSKDCKETAEIILYLFQGIEISKKSLIINNKFAEINKLSEMKKILEIVFENLADRFNMVLVFDHSGGLVPDKFFSGKNVIKFFFVGPGKFGKSVLENCGKLKEIHFQLGKSGNITLGENCFAGCNKLQKIETDSEKFDEFKAEITKNIMGSVKSGRFNKKVAKKLTINGKTVEAFKNLQ